MDEKNVSEIEVLQGLEVIRRRPSMYIDDLESMQSTTKLFMQALCHAIDEHMSGECSVIQITVTDKIATVSYDCGMPLNLSGGSDGEIKAISLLSELRACSNQKTHFSIGSEYCELGLAILNAVSSHFIVKTVQGGYKAMIEFEAGQLNEPVVRLRVNEPEHTKLSFSLDPSILRVSLFDKYDIEKELNVLQSQFSGLKINLI